MAGRRRRILGSLLVVLAAATDACDFLRDPVALQLDDGLVGVFSLLRAGQDTVAVLVVRFPPDPDFDDPQFVGIGGAGVTLSGAGATLTLVEQPVESSVCLAPVHASAPQPRTAGCYRAVLAGGVVPGARYRLGVALPGGGVVEGAAVVPSPPVVLEPATGAEIEVPTQFEQVAGFGVAVEADELAALVEIGVRETDPERECSIRFHPSDNAFGSVLLDPDEARDTTVQVQFVSCGIAGQPASADQLPARLVVNAYDTAYARYREDVLGAGSAVGASFASAGLSGAVGFFAGVGTSERAVVFVQPARP